MPGCIKMTRITLLSAATSLLVMALIFRDIEANACNETSERCKKYYFGPTCEITCKCMPQDQCENDGSCEQSSSRSCSTGYTGPYCTKSDMASRKNTSQSTTGNNSYPEYAVDRGDPDTCSSTHADDPAPQWSADLGRSREIYHFYLQSHHSHRMRYLTVYVSNNLTVTTNDICYSTGQDLALPRSELVCMRPMIGRYVIIRRTSPYQHIAPGIIYLCDLKITECEPRTFGPDCQHFCNCYNKHEVCRADGKCTSGCKCGYHGNRCLDECADGTFGYNCSSTCHCKDDSPCRKSDGHCPRGCKHSWTGITCQEKCPADKFGSYCSGTCHCSGEPDQCSNETGVCSAGCLPGWLGDDCQEACPIGMFGSSCSRRCHCADQSSTCIPETGYCPGGCSYGWKGAACDEECPAGSFGSSCTGTCHCSGGPDQCNNETGVCSAGCSPGWLGDDCQEEYQTLSTVEIAGIAVGCVAATIIVLIILWCYCRRRLRLRKDEAIKKEHAAAMGKMWPQRLSHLSQKDRDMLLKRNPAYEKHKDSLAGLSKISFNTDKRDSGIFETVDDPGYMTVSEVERSLARSISNSTNRTGNSGKPHKPGARTISVSTTQYDQQYPVFSSVYLKGSDYTDCDGAGGHMSMSTIDSDASSSRSHGGNSYLSMRDGEQESDDDGGYAPETVYNPDSSCYSPNSVSSDYPDSGGTCFRSQRILEATDSGLSSNPSDSAVRGRVVAREGYVYPSSVFSDTDARSDNDDTEYDMSDKYTTEDHEYTGIAALRKQHSLQQRSIPENDVSVDNQESVGNLEKKHKQTQVVNISQIPESSPSDTDCRKLQTQDSYFLTYEDLARQKSTIDDDMESNLYPEYDMSEDMVYIAKQNKIKSLFPSLSIPDNQAPSPEPRISVNVEENREQTLPSDAVKIVDSVPSDPIRATLETQNSYFQTYEDPSSQNIPSEYDNATTETVHKHDSVPVVDLGRIDLVADNYTNGVPVAQCVVSIDNEGVSKEHSKHTEYDNNLGDNYVNTHM